MIIFLLHQKLQLFLAVFDNFLIHNLETYFNFKSISNIYRPLKRKRDLGLPMEDGRSMNTSKCAANCVISFEVYDGFIGQKILKL